MGLLNLSGNVSSFGVATDTLITPLDLVEPYLLQCYRSFLMFNAERQSNRETELFIMNLLCCSVASSLCVK